MNVQYAGCESVSPDPAAESGLLAMVDGVYIVLKHLELSDPDERSGPQCCHLSEGERQVCAHG